MSAGQRTKHHILNGLNQIWETRHLTAGVNQLFPALARPETAKISSGESNDKHLGGAIMSDRNETAALAGTAITFLLIGMGVGAVVALLYAPKTGDALRRDLRRKYKNA